jgi:hypothetical protein
MYSNKLLISLVFLVGSLQADPASENMTAEVYPDFVVFENLGDDTDLQVRVSGPQGEVLSRRQSGAEPVFVELQDASGQTLADGLYKYEVFAVPRVTIPREVSAAMPDRDVHREQVGPGPSPLSGTFRVSNGAIVDALAVEGESR